MSHEFEIEDLINAQESLRAEEYASVAGLLEFPDYAYEISRNPNRAIPLGLAAAAVVGAMATGQSVQNHEGASSAAFGGTGQSTEQQYSLSAMKLVGYSTTQESAASTLDSAQPKYVVVRRGDTANKIADRLGISADVLAGANQDIPDINLIYVGQKLHTEAEPVAVNAADTASQTDHVVGKGQTLDKIATIVGVPVEAIIKANQQFPNPDLIHPGDIVHIPAHTKPAAAETKPPYEVYTVLPGDKLGDIADKTGQPLKKLLETNPNLKDHPDKIKPGDIVQIPAGTGRALIHKQAPPATPPSVKQAPHETAPPVTPPSVKQAPHETAPPVTPPSVKQAPHETAPPVTPPSAKQAPHETTPPVTPPKAKQAPTIEKPAATHNKLDPKTFVTELSPTEVEKILPGASPETVAANTPLILAALKEQGINNATMVAYGFATINAEVSNFKPIEEHASGRAYEKRLDLGNTQIGDGMRFKGRGFIQLTGRAHYKDIGDRLGIDLVGNPDLALDPEIAAKIFAVFLKDHQTRIEKALAQGDLTEARAVVNGRNRKTHLPNGLEVFRTAYEAASNVIVDAIANQTAPQPPSIKQAPELTPPVVPPTTPGPNETAPAASPEEQAKQLCKSLGVVYSGIMQGYSKGVEKDIMTCQIPAEFTYDSDPHYINVTIAKDLMGLLNDQKAAGKNLKVISAFRSMELSKQLRVQNGCADVMTTPSNECKHPTAIPGFSNHQLGDAFDLVRADGSAISSKDADYNEVANLAAARELHANVANDDNHFSPSGR